MINGGLIFILLSAIIAYLGYDKLNSIEYALNINPQQKIISFILFALATLLFIIGLVMIFYKNKKDDRTVEEVVEVNNEHVRLNIFNKLKEIQFIKEIQYALVNVIKHPSATMQNISNTLSDTTTYGLLLATSIFYGTLSMLFIYPYSMMSFLRRFETNALSMFLMISGLTLIVISLLVVSIYFISGYVFKNEVRIINLLKVVTFTSFLSFLIILFTMIINPMSYILGMLLFLFLMLYLFMLLLNALRKELQMDLDPFTLLVPLVFTFWIFLILVVVRIFIQ